MTYPSAVFSFITGPIRVETASNGQTILTHLQKHSHFGFMITWPFCFHFWFMWRLQKRIQINGSRDINNPIYYSGDWIPGSEQGIYFRTPGWRWDAELGMIFTKGYVGLHWD